MGLADWSAARIEHWDHGRESAGRLAGPCRFPCLLEDSLSERLSKCNVENIFHSASQFGGTLEIASCSNLPRDLFSLCRFDRMLALRTHELDFSVIRAEIRFGADQQNGYEVSTASQYPSQKSEGLQRISTTYGRCP